MHVFVEHQHDLALVRPVGRFFGGDETLELEHKLGALLESGPRNIVIDLERTLYLNSTAISTLLGTHQRAQARGIMLRLCNADHGIRSVLVILKLVNVMSVDDTLVQALVACRTEGRRALAGVLAGAAVTPRDTIAVVPTASGAPPAAA